MKGSYQALRASERHDEERVPKKYKKLSIGLKTTKQRLTTLGN